MISNLGASSVGVNRLFHGDRYENLSFADYERLFIAIKRLQESGFATFFIDSFPRCKVPFEYWEIEYGFINMHICGFSKE